jgi:hypothetical protein
MILPRNLTRAIIFVLYFSMGNTNAKGPLEPIFFQGYSGISNVFRGSAGTILSMQIGATVAPPKTPFFGILENDFSYSSIKYQWPGLGKYNYRRTYNNTSLGVGFIIFPKHDLNVAVGAKAYFYYQAGKLKTENAEIRENVKNNYSYDHFDVSLFLRLNYRINKHTSIYTSTNKFQSETRDNFSGTVFSRLLFRGQNVISLGIVYNFYLE